MSPGVSGSEDGIRSQAVGFVCKQKRVKGEWEERLDSMKQEGEDFFRTGLIVEVLRHVGTRAWLREMLKLSGEKSMSSSA